MLVMETPCLMREVKREWPAWFNLKERLWELRELLFTTVLSRKASQYAWVVDLWGEWATRAEDDRGFHYYQPRTEIWGCSGKTLPKTGQLKMGGKTAWSNESCFLLRCTDGRVRIQRLQYESIDLTCLKATFQAGLWWCDDVKIFSWNTLGSLTPINHHLNATANLSIVADHVYHFIAFITHLPIS